MPKGAVWTYENVRSHLSVQRNNFTHLSIATEFILFPHLAIAAISMGRCSVLPALQTFQPALIDIKVVISQMTEHGSDYIFASPVFWRRFRDYCRTKCIKIRQIKVAATAGASVNCDILNSLKEFIPVAEITVPYASTEVLMPISMIDLGDFSRLCETGTRFGKGIPLGVAFADMRVKTVSSPNTEGIFPSKKGVGELVVSGARVSPCYFRREERTRQSKMQDSAGIFWHRTGDAGYIDENGMIWLLGRIEHVRIASGVNIYPDQQEQFYNARLKIEECAVLVAGIPGRLLLIVPAEFLSAFLESTARTLANEAGFPEPQIVYYPGRLPADSRHNSKIDKRALEEWFDAAKIPRIGDSYNG